MNTHTFKSTLIVLRQRPSQVVFCISLLLSLLALLTTQLNRDGMLYVTAAEAFIDEGYAGARAIFPWPFMPSHSVAYRGAGRYTALLIY